MRGSRRRERLLELLPQVTYGSERRPGQTWIDPFERCFWVTVDAATWELARNLADRISAVSRGRKTRAVSEISATIGKLGELVFDRYCELALDGLPWESYSRIVRPDSGDECDLRIAGLKVDVKSRRIYSDQRLSYNFDLLVPVEDAPRPMDLYVGCGYCLETRRAYVFGWIEGEAARRHPVDPSIRDPAHAIPLRDLHPLETLEPHLRSLAVPR